MSNLNDNDRVQEASKKLLELKLRVDEVSTLKPDWMEIGSIDQIHPKEKREVVFNLLMSITHYDGLKDLIHGLSSFIAVDDKEIFEWYRSNSSVVDTAFDLTIEKFLADKFGPTAPVSDKRDSTVHDQSIKTAFTKIMVFMRDYFSIDKDRADQLIHEEGLHVWACEKIMQRPYFKPDEWIRNEPYPVWVMQDLGEIPWPVRRRIDEIRHSFTFGNWMAVIALSRSLLEYAIRDKESCFDICDARIAAESNGRNGPGLGFWIRCVKEKDCALGKLMPCIKNAGDKMMHPDGATENEPLAQRETAEKCFENIAKIIGTLYSAGYRPSKTCR